MASRWLIFAPILFATLLFTLGGLHLWEMQRADERVILQRIKAVDHVLVPPLIQAAQRDDAAGIHQLLARVASDPDIDNATLRNIDGSERSFGGLPPLPPAEGLDPALGSWQRSGADRWALPIAIFSAAGDHRFLWLDLKLASSLTDGASRSSLRMTLGLGVAALLLSLATTLLWHRRHATRVRATETTVAAAPDDHARHGENLVASPSGLAPSPTDLAYVSHELRAPLSGVLGFCRLLENSPLDARQREWLRHIHLASNGLLDTVDHVLGDERRRQSEASFDLADLLWQINCLQAPMAHERHIVPIGIVYDDVPPRLIGSTIGVRQLLTNLINNAIKYGDEGDVVTRVTVIQRQQQRIRLRIDVTNTHGSSAAQRDHLARLLASDVVDHSRATSGLVICQRLVADLNGTLNLGPASGNACTLRAEVELGTEPPWVRPAEFDLDGATIAVFQPHATLDHLIRHALTRWSAQPVSVTNPDQLASNGPSPALTLVGIERADLAASAHADWQARFDAIDGPCLLLVNAGPTQAIGWRLPPGSVVLRMPMSRYLFGRTLAGMLDERRQIATPPRPRVLVVDDDHLSQHYLDSLLPIVGARPIVAESVEQALTLAAVHDIDLVMMDLHLPDGSGLEAVARLRAIDPTWRDKPMVIMTAERDAELGPWLRENRIQDLMTKPLDERRLRDILRRYLLSPASAIVLDAPSVANGFASVENGEDSRARRSPYPIASMAASPDDHTLPVVDRAMALRLAGGREALAREMLQLLLEGLPTTRANLAVHWERGDAAGLLEAVHQLAGGCRYCGVPALSAACETLETRLAGAGIAACEREWQALQTACDRLLAWSEQDAHPPGT